ncbi:hypothetical protein CYMTET_35275 [Cymbomonas tetramitiformis]|uniref:Methyltransferase domain-containing protein n=1 Tax=Cymbomonas tetramitiformis TaxID=36881 RepID=A0AAE0F9F2_9CHLO|nr:hypothetical protein CYMTET_35275 [Cymbomonas tetramitiformis]
MSLGSPSEDLLKAIATKYEDAFAHSGWVLNGQSANYQFGSAGDGDRIYVSAATRGPIRVLDFGCGRGDFLCNLAESAHFQDISDTGGVSLLKALFAILRLQGYEVGFEEEVVEGSSDVDDTEVTTVHICIRKTRQKPALEMPFSLVLELVDGIVSKGYVSANEAILPSLSLLMLASPSITFSAVRIAAFIVISVGCLTVEVVVIEGGVRSVQGSVEYLSGFLLTQ